MSAIRRKPSSRNVMGAGTAIPTGGGAISARDVTGTADKPSYEYAWKSDEVELIRRPVVQTNLRGSGWLVDARLDGEVQHHRVLNEIVDRNDTHLHVVEITE